MREPYRSRFIACVRQGAAARDIHDSDAAGGFDGAPDGSLDARFLQRELERVALHQRSLCPALAQELRGARRILDVGCGTGGSTVALALCAPAAQLTGVDACAGVLEAAALRAAGHGVQDRVDLRHVEAGQRLPFADGAFALVTCVSMLEFVGRPQARQALLAEMTRVLAADGCLYLATPSPWRLRELHSRRWFGDWRRRPGEPWASRRSELRRMLPGFEVKSLARERLLRHRHLRRIAWLAPVVGWALPWQRLLVRRRAR